MKDIELLQQLFDQKILSILQILANDNSEEGMYLREISKAAKVSPASTYRILVKLMDFEIIDPIVRKNSKFYKFRHTERTGFLYEMLKKDKQVLQLFIDKIRNIYEIKAVVLHGEESNQRANLMLIGENIDNGKIKEICGEIREKYDFIVSPLIVSKDQFEAMTKMGLYSGQKKIVFKR
ncbi:helix-turn-helix domain-containing protein [Candidatus Woesearchaeota archaeon]|nr:helix-turn-helix domain-containing protein [Candidatus Woesearchaeota archaeon]